MAQYKNGYEVNEMEIAKRLAKGSRPSGTAKKRMTIVEEAVHNAALKLMDEFAKPSPKPSKYMIAKIEKGWGVVEKKYRCRTWNTIFECDYENEAREFLASL